jgi:hypothetical protein
MEAGLLFVYTNDSLGQIIVSITKEPYNYIGFYFTTTVTGILSTKVFLFDTFRSQNAFWLPAKATLEHVYTHPLVKKVAKKKFKNSQKLDILETFKLAIASALSSHLEYPLIPALYKLFGHRCDPVCIDNRIDQWCGQTVTDLVNNTFKNLNIFDKFKNIEMKHQQYDLDPLAEITSLFSRLPNDDLNISIFLSDTTYFDTLVDVDLSNYQQEQKVVQEYLKKYNTENNAKIIEIFVTFNLQVTTNSEFKETIKKSLQLTRKNKSAKLNETLKNLENNLNENRTSETGKLVETVKGFLKEIKNM